MKHLFLQMYERRPFFTVLAGVFLSAIFAAVVGHILYLLGLVVAAVVLLVGAAFVVGVKHAPKPCTDKRDDPGPWDKP